jgi:hypothetical protein
LGLLFSLPLTLGACGHSLGVDAEAGMNTYPTNYKADILAGMRAYLKTPAGIRDAALSEPVLKTSGTGTLYIACLRFTPIKNATDYAPPKEIAAIFMAGRLDRFVDVPKDECTGVSYAAFPELQKLAP